MFSRPCARRFIAHWTRITVLSLLCVPVLVPALVDEAGAIAISELHQNDANVTVTGVATAPALLFDDFNLEIFLQDAGGGIKVWLYDAANGYPVSLGDSLTVTSRVAQHNGITELGTATAYTEITFHGPARSLPPPLPITCAELEASFHPDYTEPNEGRLIRLDNLTITGGDWPESPGGNSLIWVDDGSAEARLYIDADTPLNGSPQPADGFSIVGLLAQYDTSAPYTSGYQLAPRFLTDVIEPGESDLPPGVVRNVTSTAADIRFATLLAGSSEVEYGLSESYGSVAGDPQASATEHLVPLTGLQPNAIYHFRVKSTQSIGTSYGPDQLLATASDQPGEIHVLMRGTAETEYAGDIFDPVAANQILPARLAQLIVGAESSVDAALYSFSLDVIKTALIHAHNNGCQVRLIIDQSSSTQAAEECEAAGIPYITSTWADNHASGLMHNKYVVVDARDEDPYNDWVWTGSANMSYYGQNDINNVLRIRDHGLARAYTIEFDEMWGSATQTPGDGARMGNRKTNNTPHEFTIAGIRIEQYMSPTDAVTERIIDAALSSDHAVYLALFSFTHDGIANALRSHRDAVPGLQVAGVFDQDQGPCYAGSEYYALSGDPCADYPWDPPADVWLDTALADDVLLHHKYLIVDVNWLADEPLVLTGSHNWSYSAETVNDENTLVLHDAQIANQYLQEFAARYHESGGSDDLGGTLTAVSEDGDGAATMTPPRLLARLTSYPNPFNPRTRIALTTTAQVRVSLRIYDARGAVVRNLKAQEVLAPGLHIFGWDGRNDAGGDLSSGVYFARATAEGEEALTQRLVLVR